MQRWQQRREPIWGHMFPGCHLTRRIPDLIEQGGFKIREMEQEYAAGVPRPMGYFYEGVATAT